MREKSKDNLKWAEDFNDQLRYKNRESQAALQNHKNVD